MRYFEMITGATLFFMAWLAYFNQLAAVTWLLPVMLMGAGAVVFWNGIVKFLKKRKR